MDRKEFESRDIKEHYLINFATFDQVYDTAAYCDVYKTLPDSKFAKLAKE